MTNALQNVLLTALILCACGCASQTQKNHYYALGVTPQAATGNGALTLPGGLGIGPVDLPESLRRNAIVSMGDKRELRVSDQHLWAGDLKLAISRVLADYLGDSLDSSNVWSYPWDTRTRPQNQISVVVEHFGGQLGGEITLRAKWKILSDNGRTVLAVDRQHFNVQADDRSYNSYVAALDALLAQYALVLAESVREHVR